MIGALVIGLAPAKANMNYYNLGNMRNYNNVNMWRYHFPTSYNRYFNNYFQGGFYNSYNMMSTFPRTVYLIDAGNSANQLNIINSTRGGTTTAAYITVDSDDYNRLVNDYNTLGMMSIMVNRMTDRVTFHTVNGIIVVDPVSISWQ